MKKGIILSILILPLLQTAAQLPDAAQIMNKSSELVMKGSMSSIVYLTIIENSGLSRKRTISMISKSYPDGTEKRLVKFIDPAIVRGTSLLFVDNKNTQDEIWIHLPALKKTRKIVSSEKGKSFMSSEFSNSDMSSPALSDFTYRHLPGSGENNQWIIESTPINNDKVDEYGYSKKTTYLNSETLQVKKMEYYNFDNLLFKIMEVKSVQAVEDGKYLIKNMTSKNIRTGRSSEILLDKIVTNVQIQDSVFSVQNLGRK